MVGVWRRSVAAVVLVGALLAGCDDRSPDADAPPTSRNGGATGVTPPTLPPVGGGFVSAWSSDGSDTWALRSTPCSSNPGSRRCGVVFRTTDGGGAWSRQGSVDVGVDGDDGADFVDHVHFADAQHGWIYDRGLFATFNGGRRWQRVDLGEPVAAVESSGTSAFALVGTCAAGAGTCSAPMRVFEGTVATGRWRFVTVGFDLPATDSGSLIVNRSGVYALVGGAMTEPVFIARTGSGRWERRTTPCLRVIIAPIEAQDGLVAACRPATPDGPVELHTSSDGGRTWALVWQHGFPSPVTSLAVTVKAAVVTLENGDVLRSTDNGLSFPTITRAGVAPLIRLSDAEHGLMLAGSPADRSLYRTGDAGATWQPVPPPR
jgi:hypothetical protein